MDYNILQWITKSVILYYPFIMRSDLCGNDVCVNSEVCVVFTYKSTLCPFAPSLVKYP